MDAISSLLRIKEIIPLGTCTRVGAKEGAKMDRSLELDADRNKDENMETAKYVTRSLKRKGGLKYINPKVFVVRS